MFLEALRRTHCPVFNSDRVCWEFLGSQSPHIFFLSSFFFFSPKIGFFCVTILDVSKMAQQVKALATRPDERSSVSRTYMVEGQNQLLQVIL